VKSELQLFVDAAICLNETYSNDLPREYLLTVCCHWLKHLHTLTSPPVSLVRAATPPHPSPFVGLFLSVEGSHVSDRRRVRGVPSFLFLFSSFFPPFLSCFAAPTLSGSGVLRPFIFLLLLLLPSLVPCALELTLLGFLPVLLAAPAH
jgi:hypothetical protein